MCVLWCEPRRLTYDAFINWPPQEVAATTVAATSG